MDGARTRGQPAAVAAVETMLRSGVPHAILLTGPAGTGKTTLALDLAAALLCEAPDPASRPCRICRACRMVDDGNHPDLHRLAPAGPGAQIGIGGSERSRGVRDLTAELALLPVEGGARVAIIEDAHRLNEDAQSALLKTLEEPAAGIVLILCAEEEERLLPTVRSRCARVRLGPVRVREIEALLGERGLSEAPLGGRLARIAGGRPGLAIAYARAPGSETIRAEIVRRLLDLRGAGTTAGLVGIREQLGRAAELATALELAEAGARASGQPGRTRGGRSSGGTGRASPSEPNAARDDIPIGDGENPAPEEGPAVSSQGGRLAAPERRRAALLLVQLWEDLARDLVLAALGERRRIRDITLLDELDAAIATFATDPAPSESDGRLPVGAAELLSAFLRRLARAAELLEGNVSPELVLDVLIVAWSTDLAADGGRQTETAGRQDRQARAADPGRASFLARPG